MFSIDGKHITITRGDTGLFTLGIKSDGEAYDYSADTVVFTVKTDTYTNKILFQKTIAFNEVVVIEPGDTEKLAYGDYVYDVQVTTEQGVVSTVIPPSRFTVAQEVTFGGDANG